MLCAVSFAAPPGLRSMLKIKIGGSSPIRLKKLKGAAFTTPASFKLVTKAIGRGTTTLTSSL